MDVWHVINPINEEIKKTNNKHNDKQNENSNEFVLIDDYKINKIFYFQNSNSN